jgi:hypothetical protein
MSKYNNTREQVKQLLTSNNFPADVGIWSEFLEIIDGLEAEDQWLPFDPKNVPEIDYNHVLLIRNNADVVCFNYGMFARDNQDTKIEWVFSLTGSHNSNCLSDLLGFYDGCSYKLVPLS